MCAVKSQLRAYPLDHQTLSLSDCQALGRFLVQFLPNGQREPQCDPSQGNFVCAPASALSHSRRLACSLPSHARAAHRLPRPHLERRPERLPVRTQQTAPCRALRSLSAAAACRPDNFNTTLALTDRPGRRRAAGTPSRAAHRLRPPTPSAPPRSSSREWPRRTSPAS